MTRIWLLVALGTFACEGPKVVAKPVLSVESVDPADGAPVSVGLPDLRIEFDRALSPFSISQSTVAVDPDVFHTRLVDDTTIRMPSSSVGEPASTTSCFATGRSYRSIATSASRAHFSSRLAGRATAITRIEVAGSYAKAVWSALCEEVLR